MAEPAKTEVPKARGSSPLRVLRNRNFARLYFAGATSMGI